MSNLESAPGTLNRPELPSSFSDSQDHTTLAHTLGPSQQQLTRRETPHLHTHPSSQTRPLPFFYPTRIELYASSEHEHGRDSKAEPVATWRSRASRKRRVWSWAARVVHRASSTVSSNNTGNDQEKFAEGGTANAVRMKQRFKKAGAAFKPGLSVDISFWVAVLFVLGSIAWVVNGFYLLLPLLNLASDHFVASAWWAFAGGTLFEGGAYLSYLEALNSGHDELFAPALRRLVSHPSQPTQTGKGRTWRWYGTTTWRDIGFAANAIQLVAASVFWISTITGLPGVIPGMPANASVGLEDGVFWTPQVVGGCGFIVASILLCLEEQRKWWLPKPMNLGWQVAFWNGVGAVGFTLCGALGYAAANSSKVEFQSTLSTFWGGWAFLIGSGVQLWETLWREAPEENSDIPANPSEPGARGSGKEGP